MLILLHPGFAQDSYESRELMSLIDLIGFYDRTQPKGFEYDGSPYLKEDFTSGILLYDEKYRFEDLALRYNVFNDEMEYQLPGRETIFALSPYQPVDMVIIAEDTFIARNYFHMGSIVPGFFKILVSGDIDLLVKMEIDYIEEQAATAFLDARPAEFVRRPDDFYIMRKGMDPEKIINVNKLIKSLGHHQPELKRFKKENKISSRNPDELSRFIAYYNALQH